MFDLKQSVAKELEKGRSFCSRCRSPVNYQDRNDYKTAHQIAQSLGHFDHEAESWDSFSQRIENGIRVACLCPCLYTAVAAMVLAKNYTKASDEVGILSSERFGLNWKDDPDMKNQDIVAAFKLEVIALIKARLPKTEADIMRPLTFFSIKRAPNEQLHKYFMRFGEGRAAIGDHHSERTLAYIFVESATRNIKTKKEYLSTIEESKVPDEENPLFTVAGALTFLQQREQEKSSFGEEKSPIEKSKKRLFGKMEKGGSKAKKPKGSRGPCCFRCKNAGRPFEHDHTTCEAGKRKAK